MHPSCIISPAGGGVRRERRGGRGGGRGGLNTFTTTLLRGYSVRVWGHELFLGVVLAVEFIYGIYLVVRERLGRFFGQKLRVIRN